MASFGTMQVNPQQKATNLDFNFLEKKPTNLAASGPGNLIWCFKCSELTANFDCYI